MPKTVERVFDSPFERALREPAWGLAKLVSILFSPPLLGSVSLVLVGEKLGGGSIWLWTALYGIGVIALPVLYVIYLMHTGEVSDFHISIRQERMKPLKVALALFFLSFLVFLIAGAPYVFQVFALIGALQTAFMMLITTRWKISGHSAGVAGFAVLLWAIYGPVALPVFLVIPLVLWARVSIDRHDFPQTLAGASTGLIFMFLALAMLARHCPGAGLVCF